MYTPSRSTRLRAGCTLTVVLALGLAACGSDDTTDANAIPAAATTDTMDDNGSMPMDSMSGDSMPMDSMMNMGDPDATPADDVPEAALARGEFSLLDTRPQGYDDTTGRAVIARSAAGTTVTISLEGLAPNVDFLSHLHAESCAPNLGGPHYQFEVGGPVVPPNEIHLAFTSDDSGAAFMTVENDMIAGLDAQAIVIHPAEFLDNKVTCADFVEDEPGTAQAVLDTAGG